ncbi:MAG: hypothetical protein QNL33_00680 [Akkermansiaceae bacterium]
MYRSRIQQCFRKGTCLTKSLTSMPSTLLFLLLTGAAQALVIRHDHPNLQGNDRTFIRVIARQR